MDDFQRRIAVARVVDGDTLEARVDLGYHCWLDGVSYRLARVNAPEMGKATGPTRAAAVAATTFTTTWLTEHAGHEGLYSTSSKSDDWRRYLAEITCGAGHNLSDDLLVTGHAVPYVAA